MTEQSNLYKPNFIHGFFSWLEMIPIPIWLFYVFLLLLNGISQHLVAWNKEALPLGDWDIYLMFSAAWFVETMLLGHFHEGTVGKLIDGYRPLLDLSDSAFARLKHEFTKIPALTGTLIFLLGIGFGIVGAISTREISPEIHFVFPALIYVIWGASSGIAFLFTYQLARQLQQLSKIFKMTKRIDIFDLSPIYAFSRYMAVLAVGIFVIVYITPLVLDPTSFASETVSFQTVIWILFSMMIFFLPLIGINRRLVTEKERLLKKARARMSDLFERVHAHIDEKDYQDVSGINSLFASMKEEIEILRSTPTWPWKPGTLRALIATLVLPILLSYVQKLLSIVLGF
jgi:hypothetical protein